VFSYGPVAGQVVVVHGVLGGVGRLAAQLAHRGGATVIGTVRRATDLTDVDGSVAHSVALDAEDPADAIRAIAPDGVDRVIEVAFSDNVDLDAAISRKGGVIAAYGTRADRPDLPFWPLLFANVSVRLLGSDDFPLEAKQRAAVDLIAAALDGSLSIPIGDPLPLDRTAEAHELVDAGSRTRALLTMPPS
jgi:NADPH2:quinone reductase